jgi:hypothetical protein
VGVLLPGATRGLAWLALIARLASCVQPVSATRLARKFCSTAWNSQRAAYVFSCAGGVESLAHMARPAFQPPQTLRAALLPPLRRHMIGAIESAVEASRYRHDGNRWRHLNAAHAAPEERRCVPYVGSTLYSHDGFGMAFVAFSVVRSHYL